MSKTIKNPLELLNLSGLEKLGPKVKKTEDAFLESVSAVGPEPTLGLLETLPGTWSGTGFNLIELPNMNQKVPGPPPAQKFRVTLNDTSETLVFSDIAGEIVNKGNAQDDIAYLGLHYLQQVTDVNLPVGQNGIHLETGLFLNLLKTDVPNEPPSIARLGSIPHGDALLAQGTSFEVDGPPQFTPADPTPFTLDSQGNRVNDTSEPYLSILKNAPVPHGIPPEAVMNPNILLERAIQGQNIIKTIVIFLDANPIPGVANPGVKGPVGGINNIPFIQVNANATSMTAIFWIETVQNPDGTTFLQLQYTQTVILDFPVFGADGKKVVDIKWPHISVATLRKQV